MTKNSFKRTMTALAIAGLVVVVSTTGCGQNGERPLPSAPVTIEQQDNTTNPPPPITDGQAGVGQRDKTETSPEAAAAANVPFITATNVIKVMAQVGTKAELKKIVTQVKVRHNRAAAQIFFKNFVFRAFRKFWRDGKVTSDPILAMRPTATGTIMMTYLRDGKRAGQWFGSGLLLTSGSTRYLLVAGDWYQESKSAWWNAIWGAAWRIAAKIWQLPDNPLPELVRGDHGGVAYLYKLDARNVATFVQGWGIDYGDSVPIPNAIVKR